ncbi:alpha/beta hydrolase [Sphingomonas profundi]|uniref:alpha/beta hydrolase n=1 Tax=Alterirhizorhabdus profundi TaxID=2681549 RepID=UPI0018D13FA7|nr:alpha/beta hydrolase [Sphingomonas profundi]
MPSLFPSRATRLAIAAGAALLAGLAALAAAPGAIMQWPDLLDRPKPAADRRIAYGQDPLQHADLWLPAGKPPFPVVLMVHGGCWQTDIADAGIMNWIADDLRAHGVAVWNIEYRGVDRPGGGYPGTFRDVAAAADALRPAAARFGLRADRVVVLGHSAGGHLGLWLAARGRLPRGSALRTADPLPIATAISIGGLPDLQAAQIPPGDTCGVEAVRTLAGRATTDRPNVYRDTSPAELMPFPARQILVNATRDRIAPPAFAAAYAARARAAGSPVTLLTVPDEGHVELIAPGTKAWETERAAILRALGR